MRLIVPKALLLQTAQIMQSRLGGLVGREIVHIPFSRRTNTASKMVQLYSNLHREILSTGGIILTSHEHILSFDLSWQQRLVDTKLAETQEMVEFQSWLTSHRRDVLDDFTLGVKTQLIYPSGPQVSVDGHPHRWECAQRLLELTEDYLPALQGEFNQQMELVQRPGGYPIIYIFGKEVEDALIIRIIGQISHGRTSFLRSPTAVSRTQTENIRRVMLDEKLEPKLFGQVLEYFADDHSARAKFLILRGSS